MQSHYMGNVLSHFGFSDCHPEEKSKIGGGSIEIIPEYLVQIMYLASATRSCILFAMSKLSQVV
jgi:hypothetical protein